MDKPMKISLEGLRVLIFGMEKESTESLKKSLIHHGALVSTVESPKKVLRLLKNIRMDLLIVDCPASIDAYGLISAIRLGDSRSANNIPAVLFTQDASGKAKSDALAAGFQEQLEKPVLLDRLLEVAYKLTAPSTKHASQRAR
jgi:CheY-like chemotaxis protein